MEDILLNIKKSFVHEMITHALEDIPNECCGIIASNQGEAIKLYRMTNSEQSPYRYSMDPKELLHTTIDIDDKGWELMAIYHSHTHSPAYPSATDIRLVTWPDAYYILISLMDEKAPEVRAFKIVNGKVSEEKMQYQVM